MFIFAPVSPFPIVLLMKKIKILFTVPNFKTAGSGREMFNIAERLDKNIFEASFVVESAGGKLFDEIKEKGYDISVQQYTVKGGANILGTFLKARKLAKAFKHKKYDIWQSFGWSSDYTEAMVAKAAGAKYVYVKKNMNWGVRAWQVKSTLSNAIVARNTTLLETYFAPNRYHKKAVFITGGVQVERFKPNTPTTIRTELGVPNDAFLISCIAQLVKVKDQPTLIKAAAQIPNTYVVLAGAARDEQYHKDILKLIDELGIKDRIIIPGSISDVNALLNASNAFVLPTTKRGGHEEGCPVALMEAMAAGTPCIASDVAGSRDLIKHGETGMQFKPDDVEGLVKCINESIANPEATKKMAEKAYKLIHEKHTLELEAAAFAKMYKDLS